MFLCPHARSRQISCTKSTQRTKSPGCGFPSWEAARGLDGARELRTPSPKGIVMAKNIYVGNLPWRIKDEELRELFQAHGSVRRAQVIKDRDTGRSRGFGFVEMDDDAEAQQAIEALNGADMDGRPLTVNEAKQREERGGGRPPSGGQGRGYNPGVRGGYA